MSAVHPGELVIDGGTLQHILGTETESLLASVGARCGSVVICRSSPAQKAAVVHMMAEHDMRLVGNIIFLTASHRVMPTYIFEGSKHQERPV